MTPSILWFTGLPASGKTTIAEAVCTELTVHHGFGTLLLDGDELRKGLCADLGLDRFSRRENARRAAHLARLVANYALRHAVVSLISPYREDREMARKIAGKISLRLCRTPHHPWRVSWILGAGNTARKKN